MNALNKRIYQQFKEKKGRYIIIILFLMVGLGMTISVINGTDSIIKTTENLYHDSNLESGDFILDKPLNDQSYFSDNQIQLEKQFYLDKKIDKQTTLRLFELRESINTIDLIDGKLPQNANEICLEKNFAFFSDYEIGDNLKIDNNVYKIVGLCVAADYNSAKKNISDGTVDFKTFSVAFLSKDGYQNTISSQPDDEVYQYSFVTRGTKKNKDLKEYLSSNNDFLLTDYVEAKNNTRITTYSEDLSSLRTICFSISIVFALLLTYIVAVFITNGIEEDRSIIGVLYSMGYRKRELTIHYLLLPMLILFIGGVLGTISGLLLTTLTINSNTPYYSFPNIGLTIQGYLIVYGIFSPMLLGLIVNFLVINKQLRREPLDLLKNNNQKKFSGKLKLRKMNFIRAYRIRQFFSEKVSYIVMILGIFLSVTLLIFSFTVKEATTNYVTASKEDIKWNYLYTIKTPLIEELNDPAEKVTVKSMDSHNNYSDNNIKVTLLGLEEDSEYFNTNQKTLSKEDVIISTSVATKFDWKKGDVVDLKDPTDKKEYQFKVKDVTQYAPGLFIFSNNKNMTQTFNLPSNYYNGVISNKKLPIDSSNIISTSTKKEAIKSAKDMLDSMSVSIMTLLISSISVFILVMFMMMKMIIERSEFSISLLEVLGYRSKDIKYIFLNGNHFIVGISSIISIVVAKLLINQLYPFMVADIQIGLSPQFSFTTYLLIVFIITITYIAAYSLNILILKKIDYVYMLKNRE